MCAEWHCDHDRTINTQTVPLAHAGHAGHGGWLRFGLHFVEMVVVMFVGMGVLGAVLGIPHSSPVEIQALYMTAIMAGPMVGWMLVRGHAVRVSAEMGAAMVLPLAVLFPLGWTGMVNADAVIDLTHFAMLPAMLLAMLVRRSHYGL